MLLVVAARERHQVGVVPTVTADWTASPERQETERGVVPSQNDTQLISAPSMRC